MKSSRRRASVSRAQTWSSCWSWCFQLVSVAQVSTFSLERPTIGGLLEAARGGPGGPAVAPAGVLDQQADDHQGGGQEQVEVHDRAGLLGAAAELAVAVHP